MKIEFVVPAIPVAQPRQRHRVVTQGAKAFAMNYTPAKHPVQDFKASCRMAAQQAYSGPPLEGPIRMALTLVFPRPANVLKRDGTGRMRHTKKPDWENVAKAVADALSGTVYRDDKQIWAASVEKWVAAADEQPHVLVSLSAE